MRDIQMASQPRRTRLLRLLIVAGAVIAALIVYLIAHGAVGLRLYSPAWGSHAPQSLNAGFVILVSAVACLAGWAAVGLIGRGSDHPRRNWLLVSCVVLVASCAMPLSGAGISAGNKVALLFMHLAVGIVLIPGLAATAPSRRLAALATAEPAETAPRLN